LEKTKGRVCLDVIFLMTSKIVKSDDNTDHYQDNLMFLLGSIWHCTHFVHAVSEHEKVVNLGTVSRVCNRSSSPEVLYFFSLWPV